MTPVDEFALMRPAHGQPANDLVPFGSLLFDRGVEVRESRPKLAMRSLRPGMP